MLSQSSINNLLRMKLERVINGIDEDIDNVSISTCKEGNKVILAHQHNHDKYPGIIFIYRRDIDIWILEYELDLKLIHNDISIYRIQVYFDYVNELVVKLGNTTDDRIGITYKYNTEGDEYTLKETIKNERLEFQDIQYFI